VEAIFNRLTFRRVLCLGLNNGDPKICTEGAWDKGQFRRVLTVTNEDV